MDSSASAGAEKGEQANEIIELAPEPSAPAVQPVVSAENDAKLKDVFGSNRVELVMTQEGGKEFVGSLVLKEQIDFKGVHHGDKAVPKSKEEKKAMAILGDVADILNIYDTATLIVEGHTATPPEKMDQWAHDL